MRCRKPAHFARSANSSLPPKNKASAVAWNCWVGSGYPIKRLTPYVKTAVAGIRRMMGAYKTFATILVIEGSLQRIVQGLLDLFERHHPGFQDLVEYPELGTPLTFEHFTAVPYRTIYGYPGIPDKYRKPSLDPETPIRNSI